MRTLADLLKSKNSIGFLRLVSAWLVVVGHSIPYGGFGEDPLIILTNNQIALGRFPVDLFFCLSGFLIVASYDRLDNLVRFLWHRFLRIYPAFWVCLILTGIGVPLLIGINFDWHYIYSNSLLLLIRDTNVGDLGHNANINSALWTLPWELKAYLIVAAVGVFRLLNKKIVWVILFLVSYFFLIREIAISPETLATNSAVTSGFRLLTFFFCGSTFYIFRDKIPITHLLGIGSLIAILLFLFLGVQFYHHSAGFFYMLCPIPFTYFVFYLSSVVPFRKINTKTDISYGVYIYGTLILNLLCYYGLNENYPLFLSLIVAITTAVSLLSWFLIEKPSMSHKHATFINHFDFKFLGGKKA
ncbi:MAG: acyltransferase [Bacteroidetes bacterium]|nr:MAG: acyltransferase [Bacteroidota bacterium]